MKLQTTPKERAIELILDGKIAFRSNKAVVKSQFGVGHYEVHLSTYACTCPARGSRQGECKHALAVKMAQEAIARARAGENEIDIKAALGIPGEDGYAIAYKALAFVGRREYARAG